MTQIKLVVADVDGTILDDEHQLDNQLAEAIKKLKKKIFHLFCLLQDHRIRCIILRKH